MDKAFLGISWRGSPLLGVTACWQYWYMINFMIVLFGLELFGFQFKKSHEEIA